MTRYALALLFPVFLFGCADEAPQPEPLGPEAIPFRIDGTLSFMRGGDVLKTIEIEVADTDSTRGRGLMHRPDIPKDTGMLFIFAVEEPQAFYMMNTPRSLDIQFYRADSTLINIAEDTTPFSMGNLYSDGPAKFVVEVAAGESRRIGLVPGDRIRWNLGAPPVPDTTSTVAP